MSSFPRNLQRKRLRSKPDYEPRPQVTQVMEDGSYRTLRPTRGWITISARRLAAQIDMATVLDNYTPPRPKKVAKLYRVPAIVPADRDTRQQRRAHLRGYIGAEMAAAARQPAKPKRSRAKKATA